MKPQMKINIFNKQITSISYLIRQSFEENRCKSSFAIFAWRVTGNYFYSPLNREESHTQGTIELSSTLSSRHRYILSSYKFYLQL